MIRTFRDLLEHFGTDNPVALNRRVYKSTSCGASISVLLPDGTWCHDGNPLWRSLTADSVIDGFTLQTIVEGSDATVDSDTFTLPCEPSDVDSFIAFMETEAGRLWAEANEDE